MKEVFSMSGGCILIWWYLEKASMKLRSSCLEVASIIWSILDRGKLSLGQALFRLESQRILSTYCLFMGWWRRWSTSLGNDIGLDELSHFFFYDLKIAQEWTFFSFGELEDDQGLWTTCGRWFESLFLGHHLVTMQKYHSFSSKTSLEYSLVL